MVSQDYNGPTPGYLEASVARQITATAVCLTIFGTLGTILFVMSRRLQKVRFMWSDVYMAISWLFNMVLCACTLLSARWGANGARTVTVEREQKLAILLLVGFANVYAVAVTFPKLAILDFYLHVFVDRFSRWTTYALAFILVASMTGNIVATSILSQPYSELPHLAPDGSNREYTALHEHLTWGSFSNIVTDVAMLILPIPVLMKLHMRWQRKIGIAFMFLLGNSGLVTSILRFSFYFANFHRRFPDHTRTDVISVDMCVVEAGVYHLAAALLACGPLVALLGSKMRPFAALLESTLSLLRHPSKGSRADDECGGGMDGRDEVETAEVTLRKEGGFVNRHNGFSETLVIVGSGPRGLDDCERQIYVERGYKITS